MSLARPLSYLSPNSHHHGFGGLCFCYVPLLVTLLPRARPYSAALAVPGRCGLRNCDPEDAPRLLDGDPSDEARAAMPAVGRRSPAISDTREASQCLLLARLSYQSSVVCVNCVLLSPYSIQQHLLSLLSCLLCSHARRTRDPCCCHLWRRGGEQIPGVNVNHALATVGRLCRTGEWSMGK